MKLSSHVKLKIRIILIGYPFIYIAVSIIDRASHTHIGSDSIPVNSTSQVTRVYQVSF